MTNREAIENLNGCIVSEEWKDGKPTGNITCDLTREILSMAISALKKQEAKEPRGKGKVDKRLIGTCPNCMAIVYERRNFCSDRGQHIDWEEDTDEI